MADPLKKIQIATRNASDWVNAVAQQGITQASEGLVKTADILTPDELFGKNNAVSNAFDSAYNTYNKNTEEYQAYKERAALGEWGGGLTDLTSSIVASIPQSAVALMSGGASLAPALSSTILTGGKVAQTTQALSNTMTALIKNPSFWSSVVYTFGPSYENAKENGASDFDAMLVAVLNSFAGSVVEVGSGIETIPAGNKAVSQWLKTALEEGGEEVVQGVIEQLTNKAVYDKDMPYLSTSENGSGVVNPLRAGQEFAGGALGGALLGGGNMLYNLASSAAQSKINAEQSDIINRSINPVSAYETDVKNYQGYITPNDYYSTYNSGKATEQDVNGNDVVDIRYQLKGVNENGIEVYEASKATKALSFAEKKKALLSSVKNEFAGRTAKFVKNGETYYAQFNDAGIRKGVYGDNKSSPSGFNAKLNIGADGNYFEPIENGAYKSSSTEQGKTTSSGIHDDTKQWDYFVKTVQSDGKLYDVLVNVADQGDNQYVYDVNLRESKKSRLTPKTDEGLQTGTLPTLSAPTISQNSGDVNSIYKSGDKNAYATKAASKISSVLADEQVQTMSPEEQLSEIGSALGYSDKLVEYMTNTYQTSLDTDVEGFADNYNRVYSLARAGVITENEVFAQQGLIANYGAESMLSAFNQGDIARKADIAANKEKNENARKAQQKNKGGAKDETKSADKSVRRALSVVGQKTGLKFRIVSDIDGNESANGYYDSRSGEIVLNSNSKNIMGTAVHELTHYIRVNASEQYAELQKAVVDFVKSNGSGLVSAVLDQYKETYGTLRNTQDILEEVTADVSSELVNNDEFLAALLTNEKFISETIEKKPTLAQKIRDFFNDVVAGIKAYIKGSVSASELASALAKNDEYNKFSEIAELWNRGFEAAVANSEGNEKAASTEESGVRYSINELSSIDFSKRTIEENIKIVSEMPPIYALTGNEFAKSDINIITQLDNFFKQYNYSANNNVLGDIKISRSEIQDDISHGLGRNKAISFAAVPKVIENGRLIDFQVNWKGRGYDTAVIAATVKIGEIPYYEAIIVRRTSQYQKFYVHEVLTQEKKDMPFKTRNGSDTVAPGGNPSIFSLLQKIQNVNTSISENSENDASESELRYQLKDTSEVDYESLIAENKKLQEKVKTLQAEMKLTEGHKVQRASVEKLAGKMLSEYKSSYDKKMLSDNLEAVFNYVASGNAMAEEAVKALTDVSKAVIEKSSELDNSFEKAYGKIDIPKIYRLSENMVKSLSAVYGSYAELKAACKGKIQISKAKNQSEVTSIDSVYQEISAQYPALFPDTLWAEEEQFERILEVAELAKPKYINKLKADEDTYAFIAAYELFDAYFDTPEIRTFADKQAAKLTELQNESRRRLAEQKKQIVQRYEIKLAELKEQKEWRIDKIRDENAVKLMEQKAQFISSKAEAREKRASTELNHKIKRIIEDFSKRILKPTDNRYVPEGLRAAILDVCQMIDLDTGRLTSEGGRTAASVKLDTLQADYRRLANESNSGNSTFYSFDPHIAEMIDGLSQTLEGKKIAELSFSEKTQVYEVLKNLQYSVRNAVKLAGEEKGKSVFETGAEVIKEIGAVKKAGFKADFANQFIMTKINPVRLSRMLVNYKKDSKLVKLFNAVADGELKRNATAIEANDIFGDMLDNSTKEYRDFIGVKEENLIDTGYYDDDGNPVKISKAMRTSIYLHSLNTNNLRHIQYGGFSVPYFKEYLKGNYENAYSRSTKIRLEPLQVSKIVSEMTEYEKNFAKAAYKFFNEFSKEKINETSLELNGYKKAVVDNYFPISSDPSFLSKPPETVQFDYTIEGDGMLKSRVNNASNPIILEGVTNVISRHIEKVSKYAGLAIPIRNLGKVINVTIPSSEFAWRSVKDTLKSVWLGKPLRLIDSYIRDLQVGRPRDEVSSVFNKFYGGYVGAVLSVNIKSTLKQFTAYYNAATEIGFSAVSKALVNKGKFVSRADRELIKKYTPALEMRYNGQSTREIFTIAQMSKLPKSIKWLMSWNEKADQAIVGRIWKASEYFVSDNFKALEKGSDEFYKRVAEVYNNTVRETQSNYTVSQRSEVLRSENPIVKTFTSFMTESFNNGGLLYDAAMDFKAQAQRYKSNKSDTNKAEYERSGKRLARAATSLLLVGNVSITALTALGMLLMHSTKLWRDDEDELSAQKFSEWALMQIINNMSGMVMYGSQLSDVIEAIIFGDKYYGIENIQLSAISDISTKMITVARASSDEKRAKAAMNLAFSVCKVLGVPAENAYKIGDSLIKYYLDISKGELGTFNSDITLPQETQLYIAYINGDKAEYERISAQYREQGKTKQQVQNLVAAQLLENDSRYIEMAVDFIQGNTARYKELVDGVKTEGVEQDIAIAAMNKGVSEIKATIKAIAESRAGGDTSSAEYLAAVSRAAEYVSFGYNNDALEQAISDEQEKAVQELAESAGSWESESTSTSIYKPLNVAQNMENGNYNEAVEIYQSLLSDKISELTDENGDEADIREEAESSMRTSLTSKLKPIYIELLQSDKGKAQEFVNILVREFGYKRSTVLKWG